MSLVSPAPSRGSLSDVQVYSAMSAARLTALTEILQPYVALDTNEITEPLVSNLTIYETMQTSLS